MLQEKTIEKSLKNGEYILGKFNDKFDLKNKKIAREIMVKHIIESGIHEGKVITLSHINCIIEQMLLSYNTDYTFLAVERDESVYNKLMSYINKNNLNKYIVPFNCEVGELINKTEYSPYLYFVNDIKKTNEKYAHLILDYCGSLSNISKDIKIALNNNLVKKNGIIAITINKRWHWTSFVNSMLSKYPYTTKEMKISKTRSEHMLRKLIEVEGEDRYQILETFDYKDPKGYTNQGANMLLMIVKRIK